MSLHSIGNILTQLRMHTYKNAEEKIDLLDQLKETGQATPQNTAWMLTTDDKNYRDFSFSIFSKNKNNGVVQILLQEMQGKKEDIVDKLSHVLANLSPPGLDEFLQDRIKLGKEEEKISVLKILKNMGSVEPYLPLYNVALKDQSEHVRFLSVTILGRFIQKSNIFTILCPLLVDQSQRIRTSIIERLKKVNDIKIIAIIFEIMAEETKENQQILISILKQLAQEMQLDIVDFILPALMDNKGEVRKAGALFFASLPDLYQSSLMLLERMRRLSFDLKKKIFKSFKHIEKQITEVVVQLLNKSEIHHRIDALIISMNLEDKRIPEGIGNVLREDVDWWVKLLGIEILTNYKQPETIAILEEHENDEFLEWSVVCTYGELQYADKLPYLQRHLANPARDIRRAALHSIYNIGTPEAMKIIEELASPQCDHFLHTELCLMNSKNPFPFAIADLEKSSQKEDLNREVAMLGLRLESSLSESSSEGEQSMVLGMDNLEKKYTAPTEEEITPPPVFEEPQYNPQIQPQPNQQIASAPVSLQNTLHFVERSPNKPQQPSHQETLAIPDEPQPTTNAAKYQETLAIPDEPQPTTNAAKYQETLAIPDEPQPTTNAAKYQETLAISDENPQQPENKEAMLSNFRSRFHRITSRIKPSDVETLNQENNTSSQQDEKSTPTQPQPAVQPTPQAQPFSLKSDISSVKSFSLGEPEPEPEPQIEPEPEPQKKSHIPQIFSKPKLGKKSGDQAKIPFNVKGKTNVQFNIRKKNDESE